MANAKNTRCRFVKFVNAGFDPVTGKPKRVAEPGSPQEWDLIGVPTDIGSAEEVKSRLAKALGIAEEMLMVTTNARYNEHVVQRERYQAFAF